MPYPNGGATYDEVKRGRKMRWWYESLADWMLANPTAKLKDMAEQFGKRQSTISIIIKTDAFKSYYEQRRKEFNSDLHGRIIAKQHGVVETALDIMIKSLEKKQDAVPLALLNDIAKTGMQALGMGTPGVQVNVQQNATHNTVIPVTVSVSDLEEARAAIRHVEATRLQGPPSPVTIIEGSVEEVIGVPSNAETAE